MPCRPYHATMQEAEKTDWEHHPKWNATNTTFQYLSGHLQFAGASATHISVQHTYHNPAPVQHTYQCNTHIITGARQGQGFQNGAKFF